MPSTPLFAPPATIDSPDMRRAGRDLLSLALMDARNQTLHLLAQFELALASGAFTLKPLADAESPCWLAGHVGWFAERWIGRNTQRALGPDCPSQPTRLASVEPAADQRWDPAHAAAPGRWSSTEADFIATRAYLLDTLESTLELLEKTPETDAALYFFRLALFHEDMWGEQLVVQAQTQGLALRLALPGSQSLREPLLVPAARWMLGRDGPGFVFDCERGPHPVEVPEFEIDAQAVTWAQYVEFVHDGGYDRPELWQTQGWAWLESLSQHDGRRAPRYVEQIGGGSGAVQQTRFGRDTRMAGGQCVMHLSWWEADAWCRWAGRRLPTEVEWDMAAHVAAGRGFHWGHAWEWTATTLRNWPGYQPGPWTDHSMPWFGRAKVLRGASFATRARMKDPGFRGFAMADHDRGFIGFRSCAL